MQVNARDVHAKLKVKDKFADWIKRRIADYGFKSDLDFFRNFRKTPSIKGGRPQEDYYLTIDTAKELAMLERNEMGRLIRRYFIEAEKQLRSKRMYAQSFTLSDIGKKVTHQKINGRRMYHLRELQAYLGFSTKSSTSNIRHSYNSQIVVWNRSSYVSEEYVKVMMSTATTRMLRQEAKNAAPLLPKGFGQPLSLFAEGGFNG